MPKINDKLRIIKNEKQGEGEWERLKPIIKTGQSAGWQQKCRQQGGKGGRGQGIVEANKHLGAVIYLITSYANGSGATMETDETTNGREASAA